MNYQVVVYWKAENYQTAVLKTPFLSGFLYWKDENYQVMYWKDENYQGSVQALFSHCAIPLKMIIF